MKEMSLAERHVQESEEHIARIAARIEELKKLGMTQAADEKRATLQAMRQVAATERARLPQVQGVI